jgi:hypothetical protein
VRPVPEGGHLLLPGPVAQPIQPTLSSTKGNDEMTTKTTELPATIAEALVAYRAITRQQSRAWARYLDAITPSSGYTPAGVQFALDDHARLEGVQRLVFQDVQQAIALEGGHDVWRVTFPKRRTEWPCQVRPTRDSNRRREALAIVQAKAQAEAAGFTDVTTVSLPTGLKAEADWAVVGGRTDTGIRARWTRRAGGPQEWTVTAYGVPQPPTQGGRTCSVCGCLEAPSTNCTHWDFEADAIQAAAPCAQARQDAPGAPTAAQDGPDGRGCCLDPKCVCGGDLASPCDCGKGEWCPQHGSAFAQARLDAAARDVEAAYRGWVEAKGRCRVCGALYGNAHLEGPGPSRCTRLGIVGCWEPGTAQDHPQPRFRGGHRSPSGNWCDHYAYDAVACLRCGADRLDAPGTPRTAQGGRSLPDLTGWAPGEITEAWGR